MPDIHLRDAVRELRNKLVAQSDNPKLIAKYVHDIWQRACNKPASVAATVGMSAMYLFFISIGIGAPFVFETAKAISDIETKIVKTLNKDGSYTSIEVRYYHNQKICEIPVNDAGLYHGVETAWWAVYGHKEREGTWKDGYWHGEWRSWDKQGHLESVTEYEMGKPIRFAVMKDGSLTDLPEDRWPSQIRKTIQTRPEGPKELANKPASSLTDHVKEAG